MNILVVVWGKFKRNLQLIRISGIGTSKRKIQDAELRFTIPTDHYLRHQEYGGIIQHRPQKLFPLWPLREDDFFFVLCMSALSTFFMPTHVIFFYMLHFPVSKSAEKLTNTAFHYICEIKIVEVTSKRRLPYWKGVVIFEAYGINCRFFCSSILCHLDFLICNKLEVGISAPSTLYPVWSSSLQFQCLVPFDRHFFFSIIFRCLFASLSSYIQSYCFKFLITSLKSVDNLKLRNFQIWIVCERVAESWKVAL